MLVKRVSITNKSKLKNKIRNYSVVNNLGLSWFEIWYNIDRKSNFRLNKLVQVDLQLV